MTLILAFLGRNALAGSKSSLMMLVTDVKTGPMSVPCLVILIHRSLSCSWFVLLLVLIVQMALILAFLGRNALAASKFSLMVLVTDVKKGRISVPCLVILTLRSLSCS